MKTLELWLFRYWRWTLAGIIALALLIGLIYWFYGFLTTLTTGSFVFWLIILFIGITVANRVRPGKVPPWIMVVAIAIPTVLWGLWAIEPVWYQEWRESEYFLWMVMAIIVLAGFSTQKGKPAEVARKVLILLLVVAFLVGAYHKTSEAVTKTMARVEPEAQAGGPTLPTNIELTITKEWSGWVPITEGTRAHWSAPTSVSYEAETGNGNWYQYPQDRSQSKTLRYNGPDMEKIRFRLMDSEQAASSVAKVAWSKY